MPWDVLKASFPFLAVLFYVLVSTILKVVTTHRRKAIALHERVLEARMLRRAYSHSLSGDASKTAAVT